MKRGRACSWAEMRKIRHILEHKERLKGAYSALERCVGRATKEKWRRAIDLMEAVGAELDGLNVRPSHAVEIVRKVPKQDWEKWANVVSEQKLTVQSLRTKLRDESAAKLSGLMRKKLTHLYATILVYPPWATDAVEGERGMTTASLRRIELAPYAYPDCHIFIPVPDVYVGDMNGLVRAWGFQPQKWLVMKRGEDTRLVLYAARGKVRQPDRSIGDDLHKYLKESYPAPYLQILGGKHVTGWDLFTLRDKAMADNLRGAARYSTLSLVEGR